MEDVYASLLQMIEQEERLEGSKVSSPDSQHAETISAPEGNTRVAGIEVWRAILDHCEQVPGPLQQAFIAQVLIFIFDSQRISPEILDSALRRASEAVQRVVQARKYTQAA